MGGKQERDREKTPSHSLLSSSATNMFLKRGFGLLARQAKAVAATEGAANPFQQQALLALGTTQVQARTIGSWIPEFWGKKSKYTEGTEFLGTPENHLDVRKPQQPLSPYLHAPFLLPPVSFI